MGKELKETRQNIKKTIEVIKEKGTKHSGFKKYDNWNEKFIRGLQQQIWEGWRNSQLDEPVEVIQYEEQKEKRMKKNEQSLRDYRTLSNTSMYIGLPEAEWEGQEVCLKKIMVENFPSFMKDMKLHI